MIKWTEEFIDKRTMMKNGPDRLRDGNALDICIKKLTEHGWLARQTGRQVINGSPRSIRPSDANMRRPVEVDRGENHEPSVH